MNEVHKDSNIESFSKKTITETVITDINIPFIKIALLIFKWTFAALPTVIFLLLLIWGFTAVIGWLGSN